MILRLGDIMKKDHHPSITVSKLFWMIWRSRSWQQLCRPRSRHLPERANKASTVDCIVIWLRVRGREEEQEEAGYVKRESKRLEWSLVLCGVWCTVNTIATGNQRGRALITRSLLLHWRYAPVQVLRCYPLYQSLSFAVLLRGC
jgi:hypothetical protein